MLKCNWQKTKKASDHIMSITYKIEIINEKIENFSVFAEEIFKTVLECGKLIIKEQLEPVDTILAT